MSDKKNPTKDQELNDSADYLLELAKHKGVACATVQDGHVIILDRNHVLSLLESMERNKQDQCVLFIKRENMSDSKN